MDKFILDACCGGKMFWFDKNHPNAIYIDIRDEEHILCDGRKFDVKPDRIMDFRKLNFPDGKFNLVVFDPPHLKIAGKNGWQRKKYGCLNPDTWRDDLKRGFEECWRVLANKGVLIMKWNDNDIKIKEILKLLPEKPLFGHTTTHKKNTIWLTFMKIPMDTPQTTSESGATTSDKSDPSGSTAQKNA